MNLWQMACKGLGARRMRSALTAFGVAAAVGAVVALTGIAWGFQASWQQAADARGADAVVTRTASRNALPSPFDASIEAQLRALPQVGETAGLLSELLTVEGAPPMFVFGWEPGSFLWRHLRLVAGRAPANAHEAVLGRVALDLAGKNLGDQLQVEADVFRIVGVFESAALVENGAVIVALPEMQRLTGQEGKVNVVNVKLRAGAAPADVEVLRQTIASRLPGFSAISSSELVQRNALVQLAKAMSVATIVLALVLGTTAVFNTMLMSLFERTRELALLSALGWRRSRVIALLLVESLVLAAIGGAAGVLFGVAGAAAVEHLALVRGKIHGEITPELLALAAGLTFALGFLGGLYPAWRAARLAPAEALRHE